MHQATVAIILLPVRGNPGIRSRQYVSCRLPVHPIATIRQLSTTPTAANSSQLMLFLMPLAPHRCVLIEQGRTDAVPCPARSYEHSRTVR